MKAFLKRGGFLLAAFGLAWLCGCRTSAPIRVMPEPVARAEALTRTGFAVQAGAFSVLDNARALAGRLNALGLDAYYFPDDSGLYKVRFGNFPSREIALRAAGRLAGEALIEDYFIVSPGPYAVSAGRVLGDDDLRRKIVATAEKFMGVEYAWGGTSSREGFDCSGLARAVYELNGLSLPRSSAEQYRAGEPVPGDRVNPGDLVFFALASGRPVSHVGIYVGHEVFIHAPGEGTRIRKDSLNNLYFREHFSGARTYLVGDVGPGRKN